MIIRFQKILIEVWIHANLTQLSFSFFPAKPAGLETGTPQKICHHDDDGQPRHLWALHFIYRSFFLDKILYV